MRTPEGNGDPVTAFRAPFESMENTEMLLVPPLATKRKLPPASVVTYEGPVPGATDTGKPLNGASAPELSMEKAETSFEARFAVYRNFPPGCTRTLTGVVPVGTAEPTAVSCPEAAILKAATVFATGSVTNRNLPLESMAIADGLPPIARVNAGGDARVPVESKVYVDTTPAPALVTNSIFPVVASALGPAAVGRGQGAG